MMDEVGPALGGMIVPFAIITNVVIVNMQGQHAAVGFAQDVHDGRTVGLRKRNRGTEDAERIGGNQQSCSPTP